MAVAETLAQGEANDALAVLVPKPSEVTLGDGEAGSEALKLTEPLAERLPLGESVPLPEPLRLAVPVGHCVTESVAQPLPVGELQYEADGEPVGEAL